MKFRTGWLNSTCKSQIHEKRKLRFPPPLPPVFFEFSPLRKSPLTKRFVDVEKKAFFFFFSNFSEYEKSHPKFLHSFVKEIAISPIFSISIPSKSRIKYIFRFSTRSEKPVQIYYRLFLAEIII